jgi:hypothetical protein
VERRPREPARRRRLGYVRNITCTSHLPNVGVLRRAILSLTNKARIPAITQRIFRELQKTMHHHPPPHDPSPSPTKASQTVTGGLARYVSDGSFPLSAKHMRNVSSLTHRLSWTVRSTLPIFAKPNKHNLHKGRAFSFAAEPAPRPTSRLVAFPSAAARGFQWTSDVSKALKHIIRPFFDKMPSNIRKRKLEDDPPKFYAVRSGHEPGIYLTWPECQEQISGFKGAQCRCRLCSPFLFDFHFLPYRSLRHGHLVDMDAQSRSSTMSGTPPTS